MDRCRLHAHTICMAQSQQCGMTLMHQSSVHSVWRVKGWGLPWRYGPRATDGGFGESWGACMSTEIISSLEYDMTCQTNQPWSNVCWADKVLRYLGRHITIRRLCGCFMLFPRWSSTRSFYRLIGLLTMKEPNKQCTSDFLLFFFLRMDDS